MQSLLIRCSKQRASTGITTQVWRPLLLLAGMVFVLLFGLNHSAHAASFTPTGSMTSARNSHTATLLDSGSLLIAGGFIPAGGVTLSGTELYDPATESFSATGSMAAARRAHTATKLGNGKVLIAGGYSGGTSSLSSAELYDPATKTFSSTGSLVASGRQLHTATLLKNGKVLLTGGRSASASGSTLNTAEIYDPESGSFAATSGTMTQPRAYHTATLLEDGRVLITGGLAPAASTKTTEIFDPATGLFTVADEMKTARNYHAAVLLNNGTVLITGGATGSTGASLNSAEIYDLAEGEFRDIGSMSAAHSKHTATLLANGYVLIAGSSDTVFPSTFVSNIAEVYIPGSDFAFVYDMNSARANHTATLLANGRALLAGGSTDSSTATASAELFGRAPGDCDDNDLVTLEEVQSAFSMFLGLIPVTSCVDTSSSNGVSAAEVQKVVNGFLVL